MEPHGVDTVPGGGRPAIGLCSTSVVTASTCTATAHGAIGAVKGYVGCYSIRSLAGSGRVSGRTELGCPTRGIYVAQQLLCGDGVAVPGSEEARLRGQVVIALDFTAARLAAVGPGRLLQAPDAVSLPEGIATTQAAAGRVEGVSALVGRPSRVPATGDGVAPVRGVAGATNDLARGTLAPGKLAAGARLVGVVCCVLEGWVPSTAVLVEHGRAAATALGVTGPPQLA